jgi:hypothetical protein
MIAYMKDMVKFSFSELREALPGLQSSHRTPALCQRISRHIPAESLVSNQKSVGGGQFINGDLNSG